MIKLAKTPKPRSKIMMLIPNLGFGGAQRVFHDHGELLGVYHDVTEAVFSMDDGHAFPTGNMVVSLDVDGGGGPLAKLRHFVQRAKRLAALKRARGPALTISHLEGADYVNLLARGPGRTLLCIHGSKLHDANINGPLGLVRRRLLIPILYNRADAIVTVSHEIALELVEMGVRGDLLHTIHNFFDPAAISSASHEPLSAAEAAIFAGPPVLVTSGRLTLQKNQAPLIAIFAELLKRCACRMIILGDGELRQPLIDQARSLGLRTFVAGDGPLSGDHDLYFLGFQDNPFRLQRQAAAFVLTSGWEGFPMVLGEAMACGLPIIAADCPTGPREFLAPSTIGHVVRPLRSAERGEFGLLLPIPDVADPATIDPWVNELNRLLLDADELRAMAAVSLGRAEDFNRDKVGTQWLALIAALVA